MARYIITCFLACLAGAGCSSDMAKDGSWFDAATDTGWWHDASDVVADTAADAPPPPEDEVDADFSEPKASGRYVFVANGAEDYVVAIDSLSLGLEIVKVGRKPRTLATDGLVNSAMVINSASHDMSIIRKTTPAESTVTSLPSVRGLESIEISPAGTGAIVFHDFDLPPDPGVDPLENYQDVMVVDLGSGEEQAVQRTCGYMPREVEYDDSGLMGFIVTKAGVSVVDLGTVMEDSTLLPTIEYPTAATDVKDVDIDGTGSFALMRFDVSAASTSIWILDLVGTDHQEVVLPDVPYDLDLSPSGDYAVAVMPATRQIAFIPLPYLEETPFYLFTVEEMYAGQAQFSHDGSKLALFSNQAEEELLGVFDLRTASLRVYQLYKTVKTIAFTPDDGLIVVIHRKMDGSPEDPTDYEQVADHSHGYSLLRVSDGYVKQQLTQALPEPFLVHPGGLRIYLMQRSDSLDVREVQVIYTDTFVVHSIPLGSPPVSMGYVPETDKIFVSQDHPSGRITFLDAFEHTQTITGFEINDWIVE